MSRGKNHDKRNVFNPLDTFKIQNTMGNEAKNFIKDRQNMIGHSKKCAKNYFNKLFERIKGLRMRECKKFISGVCLTTLFVASPILKDIQPVYAADLQNNSPINALANDMGIVQNYGVNLEESTFEQSPNTLSMSDDQLILAIIDTGINPDLEVFKDHLIQTEGFEAGEFADSHGNEMASVALDTKHDMKIMPFNYSSDKYPGHAQAIRQAVDNGADAISMSFSIGINGIMYKSFSQEIQEAIDYAYQQNVPVFVAAGNEGSDYPESTLASLNHVFAVAAVDKNGNRPDFSSVGQNVFCSDLGVDVQAINLDGQTVYINGTSPATPRAATKSLMVKGKFPDISVDQLAVVIAQNSTDLGTSGRDDETGYGIFNPEKVKGPLPEGRDLNAPNVIHFESSMASFDLTDVSNIDETHFQTSISGNLIDGGRYAETKVDFKYENGAYYPNLEDLTQDGYYQLNIYGSKDEDGNITDTKKFFIKDTTPPKIEVSHKYFNDDTNSILLDIKMSDYFGVESYTAYIDHQIIDMATFYDTSEKNCEFDLKISPQKLAPGRHSVYIVGTDKANSYSEKYDFEVMEGEIISFEKGTIVAQG